MDDYKEFQHLSAEGMRGYALGMRNAGRRTKLDEFMREAAMAEAFAARLEAQVPKPDLLEWPPTVMPSHQDAFDRLPQFSQEVLPLEEILKPGKPRKRNREHPPRPWQKVEEALVREEWGKTPFETLGHVLKRSADAIRLRGKKMGLPHLPKSRKRKDVAA